MDQTHSILRDRFGRRVDYLRLSVTDRCDLRCRYCMPSDGAEYAPPDEWLTFDEIEKVVGVFAKLGVRRVRLTGGEPLVRAGIASLVRRLAAIPGVEDLSLSTNGTRLAGQAAALRDAGLGRVNVSLDSLDRRRFHHITGRDVLPQVLAGLDAAHGEGLTPVKLNMVVMQGVNDDEIEAMVAYCLERQFTLRLIEAMPMGDTGRSAAWLDLQPVQARLRQQFGLSDAIIAGGGPARYLSSPDGRFTVGFITPLSRHFCETCNRLRMGVDGRLFTCLGHEPDGELRSVLRLGGDARELSSAILAALARKPERHQFREQPGKLVRFMAATGG